MSELYHYGKGHDDNPPGRGSGRYPYGSSIDGTVKSLSKHMQGIGYSEYSSLKSPEETERSKSGSCHDQVFYEMDELKKKGVACSGVFVIERDEEWHGGVTHSFVVIPEDDHVLWLENAWEEKAGVHEFDNEESVKKHFREMQDIGQFGDPKRFPILEFAPFIPEHHKAGESLQELVDICLNEDQKPKELKHYGVGIDDSPPPPGRGSGRYPKGSGDKPYQHGLDKSAKDHFEQNGEPHREKLSDLKKLPVGISIDDKFYQLNCPTDHELDKKEKISRSVNCANCVNAFELTQRGYDVTARKCTMDTYNEYNEVCFKDAKFVQVKSQSGGNSFGSRYKKILDDKNPLHLSTNRKKIDELQNEAFNTLVEKIKEEGSDYSRGIVRCEWTQNILRCPETWGHVFNYMCSDGNVTFYDAQVPYAGIKGVSYPDIADHAVPDQWMFMRTDNKELTEAITRSVYSTRR